MKMNTTSCTPLSGPLPFRPIGLGLLLVTLSAGLASCFPRPPITSYVDPDFAGRPYTSVIAWFDTPGLDWRQKLESTIQEEGNDGETRWTVSGKLVPPTRQWDSASRMAAFVASGADGLLKIEIAETDQIEEEVPAETKTTQSTRTTSSSSKKGEAGSTGAGEVTTEVRTTTKGGYRYAVDRHHILVSMIDLATGRTMWVATLRQDGDLLLWTGKIADQILDQLQRDRMIR